jgi:signal transduction histidine kinase
VKLFSSLTNRIFVATAVLVVLVIAVAVYRINVAVTVQAENELRRGLEESARVLEESRATLVEHFSREARLVADLSNLKAAVTTRDPPTVQPIVEAYQQRIAAELLVVTDPTGRVLAQAGRLRIDPGDPAAQRTIREAAAGRERTGLWPGPDGPVQVISVPSFMASSGLPPELIGTVTIGLSLDEATAQRFKSLTNSDIAFAVNGRIEASTLPSDFHPRLSAHIGAADVRDLPAGDDVYVVLSRPLIPAMPSLGPDGSEPDVTALIVRSRTERLRFLEAVHRELMAAAAVAVLAATLLSYAIARTVTRPLGTITATMRDMAATGDLTRRIELPPTRRLDDEDARMLATTFNAMTDSIARFQREASQRERLSALGRLSTVVAHEIRNPLMIIKTALRGLRRPAVPPEALQDAVSSIEEEVHRLNRVVSEVLDFARPIRFDLAAADVNAVCDGAMKAAAEGLDSPAAVILDERRPVIHTDAERLRLALVNVITNACHAVAGRGTRPEAGAAVSLRTRATGTGGVIITISDTGTGIAPEDLPNVFAPYFTTRRTGTGLGLAISRNIIEGLGGTISVISRAGEGTDVIIELPAGRGAGRPEAGGRT